MESVGEFADIVLDRRVTEKESDPEGHDADSESDCGSAESEHDSEHVVSCSSLVCGISCPRFLNTYDSRGSGPPR